MNDNDWLSTIQSHHTNIESVQVLVSTWNVNAKIEDVENIRELIFPAREEHLIEGQSPEIIVFGLQEMVELSTSNVIMSNQSEERSQQWLDRVRQVLKERDASYELIATNNMVGLWVSVFSLRHFRCHISRIKVSAFARGVGNMFGNKGAVYVRMNILDTSLCFVCAHFAAHRENIQRRNDDFHAIIKHSGFDSILKFDTDAVVPNVVQSQAEAFLREKIRKLRKHLIAFHQHQYVEPAAASGSSAAHVPTPISIQRQSMPQVSDGADESFLCASVDVPATPWIGTGADHDVEVDADADSEVRAASSAAIGLAGELLGSFIYYPVKALPSSALSGAAGTTGTPATTGSNGDRLGVGAGAGAAVPLSGGTPSSRSVSGNSADAPSNSTIGSKSDDTRGRTGSDVNNRGSVANSTLPFYPPKRASNFGIGSGTLATNAASSGKSSVKLVHPYAATDWGETGAHRSTSSPSFSADDHDIVIWFGDLNYRISSEIDSAVVGEVVDSGKAAFELADSDQLNQERAEGNVFLGFHEGLILFNPTYKYTPGTHEYDKKARCPAWCDRVLWRVRTDIQLMRSRSQKILKEKLQHQRRQKLLTRQQHHQQQKQEQQRKQEQRRQIQQQQQLQKQPRAKLLLGQDWQQHCEPDSDDEISDESEASDTELQRRDQLAPEQQQQVRRVQWDEADATQIVSQTATQENVSPPPPNDSTTSAAPFTARTEEGLQFSEEASAAAAAEEEGTAAPTVPTMSSHTPQPVPSGIHYPLIDNDVREGDSKYSVFEPADWLALKFQRARAEQVPVIAALEYQLLDLMRRYRSEQDDDEEQGLTGGFGLSLDDLDVNSNPLGWGLFEGGSNRGSFTDDVRYHRKVGPFQGRDTRTAATGAVKTERTMAGTGAEVEAPVSSSSNADTLRLRLGTARQFSSADSEGIGEFGLDVHHGKEGQFIGGGAVHTVAEFVGEESGFGNARHHPQHQHQHQQDKPHPQHQRKQQRKNVLSLKRRNSFTRRSSFQGSRDHMCKEAVHLMSYDRGEHCCISDHKPVRALMSLHVKRVNWGPYERHLIDTYQADCTNAPYRDDASYALRGVKPLMAAPPAVKLHSLCRDGDRKPLTLHNQLLDKYIGFVVCSSASSEPSPDDIRDLLDGGGSGGRSGNTGAEATATEKADTTIAARCQFGYLPPWLHVQPMQGVIGPGESISLTVWNDHEQAHMEYLHEWERNSAFSEQQLPTLGPLLRLATNLPSMELCSAIHVQSIIVPNRDPDPDPSKPPIPCTAYEGRREKGGGAAPRVDADIEATIEAAAAAASPSPSPPVLTLHGKSAPAPPPEPVGMVNSEPPGASEDHYRDDSRGVPPESVTSGSCFGGRGGQDRQGSRSPSVVPADNGTDDDVTVRLLDPISIPIVCSLGPDEAPWDPLLH